MKNLFKLGMSTVLFLSACAPKSDNVNGVAAPAATREEVQENLINLWRELNVGNTPNTATAAIIFKLMNPTTQKALQSGGLPTDRGFMDEISAAKDRQKRVLSLRDVPYLNDQQVISGTAIYSLEGVQFSSAGYTESLSLAREQEIQKRAMKNINDTFEARSVEIAQQIAGDVLRQVPQLEIEKLEKLKGTEAEKIEEILSALKKYDKILAGYDFSKDNNAKLIILGFIARALGKELAKNGSVQHLIKTAQDVVKTASLVKEICGLVDALEQNRKDIKKNMNSMIDSLEGVKDDLDRLRRDAEMGLDPTTKAEAKRLLSDMIYGRIKPVNSPGILSQPIQMSANLTNFANSADAAAKNLSTIVQNATKITQALGIKVDPNVAKALDSAEKIAKGVSLAKTVFAAAATGGLIGALGAFSGGGGLSALGIGGGDSSAADIAAIKQDIAEIKKVQKEILQTQVETMKMIQNVAKMMESFHREQMYVMREMREEIAVLKDISLFMAHENIQACHTMVEYALQGDKNPFVVENTVNLLRTPRSFIFSYIKDRESLNQFVRSSSARTYENCQEGLNKAFGSLDVANSPLKLSMQQSQGFLGTFANENYTALTKQWNSVDYDQRSFGIHLPAVNLRSLSYKINYASNSRNYLKSNFELDTLISTEALERYVAALLILGPLISFDKADWEGFLRTGNLENVANSSKRQLRFLDNALVKVQSAIAQESLIAGEPILPLLASDFSRILGSPTEGCDRPDVRADITMSKDCSIKGNKMLRGNLLLYVLNKRMSSQFAADDYSRILAAKDVHAMGELLGSPFRGKLVAKERGLVIDWNYGGLAQDLLPDANDIFSGKITYTENLTRLLSLQQKIVAAILEMSPSILSSKTKRDYLSILAIKN